jgi:hypothetical protein
VRWSRSRYRLRQWTRTVSFSPSTRDRLTTDRPLAASRSDSDHLEASGVEAEPGSGRGSGSAGPTDDCGETDVDGVSAAGRITDTHHQAVGNAGDGARVAVEIVGRADPDSYNDWGAPDGRYGRVDRDVPVGVEAIDHGERRRRAEHATDWMRTFPERE